MATFVTNIAMAPTAPSAQCRGASVRFFQPRTLAVGERQPAARQRRHHRFAVELHNLKDAGAWKRSWVTRASPAHPQMTPDRGTSHANLVTLLRAHRSDGARDSSNEHEGRQ